MDFFYVALVITIILCLMAIYLMIRDVKRRLKADAIAVRWFGMLYVSYDPEEIKRLWKIIYGKYKSGKLPISRSFMYDRASYLSGKIDAIRERQNDEIKKNQKIID